MKVAVGFLFQIMNHDICSIPKNHIISQRADRIDALYQRFVHIKRKVRAPQDRMLLNWKSCYSSMESATEKIPLN